MNISFECVNGGRPFSQSAPWGKSMTGSLRLLYSVRENISFSMLYSSIVFFPFFQIER